MDIETSGEILFFFNVRQNIENIRPQKSTRLKKKLNGRRIKTPKIRRLTMSESRNDSQKFNRVLTINF